MTLTVGNHWAWKRATRERASAFSGRAAHVCAGVSAHAGREGRWMVGAAARVSMFNFCLLYGHRPNDNTGLKYIIPYNIIYYTGVLKCVCVYNDKNRFAS